MVIPFVSVLRGSLMHRQRERVAQCHELGAPGIIRGTAIVRCSGTRYWPLALNRVVRDHRPEREFQAYASPVYLIEINILLFAFHVFANLETAKASSSAARRHPKLENRKRPDGRRRKTIGRCLKWVNNGPEAMSASRPLLLHSAVKVDILKFAATWGVLRATNLSNAPPHGREKA
jgi:hypothetical protein